MPARPVYDPDVLLTSLLPVSTLTAFAVLTLALAALWLPAPTGAFPPAPEATTSRYWWSPALALPAAALAVASLAAFVAGIVTLAGIAALVILAVTCAAAAHHAAFTIRVAAHVAMFLLCAGLLLHVVPGFDNPLVLRDVVLTPAAQPYTKYLNFDKGAAGLLLLGVYAPQLTRGDKGLRHLAGVLWRFAVMTAAVMALSLAVGYVRWEPKSPAWWPLWLWSMVFLTALPEEAVFRGVVQTGVERWLGGTRRAGFVAVAIAGVLFGLAHIAGGWRYAGLATAAGIGYGWIYLSSRSIGAAIAAHAGLNAVHFFLFTYPTLEQTSG